MNRNAPPPPKALAALLLALAFALALAPCPSALAAGALPWLAPGQQNASAAEANAASPAAPAKTSDPAGAIPEDAAGQAQYEVLRQYFRRQMTLAEDFPEVFSRRVKDSENLAFLAMCERQRRRGLLARFRAGQVDVSGLTFTRVTNDPDLARIRVTGRYSFFMEPKIQETLEEDALFVLLPEQGGWKIFERREGWRP
jgi:hypothetical protein